ncbi:MAG: hypothetical protein KDD77_01615 [Caldilineaceae bacterium]|nr:hypothetical protein [Caldilineaceae bacterium]
MSESNRATLTFVLWLFSAVVLGALFISAAAQGELTPWHVVLAFVVLGLAVVGTPYILGQSRSEAEHEKTKRRRIDNLLRDMSDEELVELKQRLSGGDESAESVIDLLGDDGELARRG